MRLSSYLEISVIGPEIAREGLQRLLQERGFNVRSWPFSQLREMMKIIGDGHGHLVVMPGSAKASAALFDRLRRDAPSARFISLCEDMPTALTDAIDCTVSAAASLDTMTAVLARMAQETPPRDAKCLPPAKEGEIAAPAQLGEKLLSAREGEILCCLANGYSNKQVARELNITEATVKVHVKTILRKLHLMNRTQAAIWAVQNGLVQDADRPPSSV